MSETNNAERSRLIKLIHVYKHKLGMDEITYREFLKKTTSKNSAKDMTIDELKKVTSRLHSLDFKPAGRAGRAKYNKNAELKVKSRSSYKLRALWIDGYKRGLLENGSDASLNKFVRISLKETSEVLQTKVLPYNWQVLSNKQADICIRRLRQWFLRLEKNNGK